MQKILSSVTRQIQDLAISTVTKDYKLEGTIGKGNFSVVKRATDRKTGKKCLCGEKVKNAGEKELIPVALACEPD